jgi:myo-inositol-1(or 4)-monophosphatase
MSRCERRANNPTMPLPSELLAVCTEAVEAAGAILIEGLERSDMDVVQKSERTSIVTWADVTAQAEIFRIIHAHFPGAPILGEEGDADGTGEFTFIVDPLDGTSNYAHGIPFACSSVAVRDADGVVAGAIFEPFRRELFTASKGGGAFLNGTRLSVSSTSSVSKALACTGLQSDDPEHIAGHLKRLGAMYTHGRGARQIGSPALCMAYVAAGRIDAFFERDATYAWDVAAGSIIITEAGGTATELADGRSGLNLYDRSYANVLATNGHLHTALHDLLAATGTLS